MGQNHPIDCIICEDNKADSVFMNCGHGGMCFKCSVDVLSSTKLCPLCRQEI